MKKIIVINGPNLNLLGERQPEIYGTTTLPQLETMLKKFGKELGYAVECFQFNSEGEIVECLQTHRSGVAGIVMNPAGYSHTSVVILDAIYAVKAPVVEVHISNIYSREEFRRKSITARGCAGIISGLGIDGYKLAIQYIANTAKG
ncbi:MAG: type II 3-dehydroquinate dehydratase [Candidatus Zixiibacteriota bacterium]